MADPILYSTVNRRLFISAPTLTRWRARHRGPRESFKINSEITQLLYDIRVLYEKYDSLADQLNYNTDVLEQGLNLTQTYRWADATTPADNPIALTGVNDITLRLSQLAQRVRALEIGG